MPYSLDRLRLLCRRFRRQIRLFESCKNPFRALKSDHGNSSVFGKNRCKGLQIPYIRIGVLPPLPLRCRDRALLDQTSL